MHVDDVKTLSPELYAHQLIINFVSAHPHNLFIMLSLTRSVHRYRESLQGGPLRLPSEAFRSSRKTMWSNNNVQKFRGAAMLIMEQIDEQRWVRFFT